MDILDDLLDYGESRLEHLTDSYRNAGTVDEARATALLAQAQGTALKNQKTEERKDRTQNILETALYVLLAIGALGSVTYMLIWVRKNSK